jgi:hypothetical protein
MIGVYMSMIDIGGKHIEYSICRNRESDDGGVFLMMNSVGD